MKDLLAQVILVARNRNDDGTGWMQLLVIVILGVFYAVGSLLKAKSNKTEQQEEEQLTDKLRRRPPEGAKGLPKQPFQQLRRPTGPAPQKAGARVAQVRPPRRKIVRPQPVVQKVAAEAERAVRFPTLEPLEEPELGLAEPQLEPELQELPEFTTEAIEKLGDKRAGIAAETPQAKYLAEILLDYADPGELRRAILHYEILGKPLSLRGPSGHIIGL